MKVVLVYLGRRGAGGWLSYEMAHHWPDEHALFAVLSVYSEYLPAWMNSRVRHFVVNTFQKPSQALISILVPVKIKSLVKIIIDLEPDALLFPMFHPWNASLQTHLAHIPSVVFVHDPLPHPGLLGWFYGKLEDQSIYRATRCVVMSEKLKPLLAQRHILPEKTDVIPLGPTEYKKPSQLRKPTGTYPTLLFFGRITSYKGVEYLLQAVAEVVKRRPVHLLIAGEGNLKPVQSLLKAIPSVEVINHWINESEIATIFSRADFIVLPYTSASQSGVIPIAANFSLPVITTLSGGIPEQVKHDFSGWLVQPGSVQALVEMIDYVLDHPSKAREVGRRLHDEYYRHRDWEKISSMVSDSVESAVKDHKQSL